MYMVKNPYVLKFKSDVETSVSWVRIPLETRTIGNLSNAEFINLKIIFYTTITPSTFGKYAE
jgi:hypothetical protein